MIYFDILIFLLIRKKYLHVFTFQNFMQYLQVRTSIYNVKIMFFVRSQFRTATNKIDHVITKFY